MLTQIAKNLRITGVNGGKLVSDVSGIEVSGIFEDWVDKELIYGESQSFVKITSLEI